MPLASYLRTQRSPQSFQGWNNCFLFFSKHPQQIKCTPCVSLEFAAVQLICGILSHLSSLSPPSWLPPLLVSPENTYSHARMHTLLLSVLPFLLELCALTYMDSRGVWILWSVTSSSRICKDGAVKECFKLLWVYIPLGDSVGAVKFLPHSLNRALKLMDTGAEERCVPFF